MRCFFASFLKDLLILRRDRAGLAVLFLMPMALVLVISLVQNNILAATGQSALKLLYVDEDQGAVGRQLRQRLEDSGGLQLLSEVDGQPLARERARVLVAVGDYQFALLIPPGTSERLAAGARQRAEAAAAGTRAAAGESGEIRLLFDPTVQGVFRTAVLASLRHALLGMEVARQQHELARLLAEQFGETPPAAEEERAAPLLAVAEESAGETQLRPNAVQQNVPAWALFGMFFIVVPLSGALLRERQEGTLRRLLSLPVPYWAILGGKTMAYVVVCLIQFGLMLLVGKFVLPLLGTPVLDLGNDPVAVFLLALGAALAATGYGLLIGNLARSYDQASMLGPVSVVIAAALGGVMVPVYVMPPAMQQLSRISPLAWGLDGFLELFVRGGDLATIWPHLLGLLAFFGATLILSLMIFSRRSRFGG